LIIEELMPFTHAFYALREDFKPASSIVKCNTWGSLLRRCYPSRFADIIAVRGDPLGDLSVLEKVDFVMKGGIVIKNLPTKLVGLMATGTIIKSLNKRGIK